MEEFTRLIEIERQRREVEAELEGAIAKLNLYAIELGIEGLKQKIELLKKEERQIEVAGAFILGDQSVVVDNIEFSARKGRPSARPKPGVELNYLPKELVRLTLNKEAALKMYKKDPKYIEQFVDIQIGEPVMTYRLLTDEG
jgi:vacuolar-type H+-ATPase subunit D/Vma8